MIDTEVIFERQFRLVADQLTDVAPHRLIITAAPTVSVLANSNLVQRLLGRPV